MSNKFVPVVEIVKVIRGPYDDEAGNIWNLCLTRSVSNLKEEEEEYFYRNMKDAMDDVDRLHKTGPFVIDEWGNSEQDHTHKQTRKVIEHVQ